MKFTLKEYQQDAVDDVLARLDQAREMYRGRHAATSSFSLTATTGAGKTVMAAAVLEALFEGDDDNDFDADPSAVVLWFTDDPALNEQTRFRLLEASDLASTRLRVIEPTYADDRLRAGNVYFLNAQKLSRNALLVRESPTDDGDTLPFESPPTDLRALSFWDVLRNTIEDPHLTLYVVLDEAHRGMRRRTSRDTNERQTVVRRLIDGEGGSPPVPVVWGISATVRRFEEAMQETGTGRVHLPPVEVSAARVQESGLLKDDIRLDFPAEPGMFETTLLARAARRTQEATQLWLDYALSQQPALEPVVPLLVVQLPNTPDDELLASAFRTVREAWPDLADDAMAHVFGEHRTIELAGFTVPHLSPEKVQDSTWVRVLFAKDAISTGWDCPRAEVLMSFRPAQDEDHITQLLGRMVRTPLARRVPGDDRLNSVECVLPRFNRSHATSVAELLLGRRDEENGGSGGGDGRRTLVEPVDLTVNPGIDADVWAAFDALPSHTLPRRAARPVKRLLALAQALSRDGLRPGARRDAIHELCAVLDGLMARHRDQVETAATDVRTLTGETIVAGVGATEEFASEAFEESADSRAVTADFAKAGRVLTRDLAREYVDRIAVDHDDDALSDAMVLVAALARLDSVGDTLDVESGRLADHWLAHHRVAIKALGDERRAAYDEIRAMSTDPVRIDVMRPRVRAESTRDAEGLPVEGLDLHLMADGAGRFPAGSLNAWETAVVRSEMARADFRAWYRNPGRPSPDALAVAYEDSAGRWRRLCPDFVFFHGVADVRVSIVDPHGHHLSDALPKLRGLAAFAEEFGRDLHRVESLSRLDDDRLRVLDLTDPGVREAVRRADDAEALYGGAWAADYR